MKIGILTFHWATNYGAILQCYALQSYIESLGHTVEVIDYKPRRHDDTLYTFFRYRKFLKLRDYLENKKKELALVLFRKCKLKMSRRYYSFKEMPGKVDDYDAIISGSDQVLNTSFLLSGEGRGIKSPTYFLGFQFNGKRIGYALSFGCVKYPQELLSIAAEYIKHFNIISVRECSGIDIVASMGRNDAVVAPDPTLLMDPKFYHHLADDYTYNLDEEYIYSFFIRNISERKITINELFKDKKILWNNEDGNYTMQGWLSKIKHSKFVVTDSFHCMVMCLKFHKPFVIVTEEEGNVGMNDRFYTLLEKVSLEFAIINKKEIISIQRLLLKKNDWSVVDVVLGELQKDGSDFISNSLS